MEAGEEYRKQYPDASDAEVEAVRKICAALEGIKSPRKTKAIVRAFTFAVCVWQVE